MHSSGLITRKFGPSQNASTGQTSTQSVYLQRMQASVTTKVMAMPPGQPPQAPQQESTPCTGLLSAGLAISTRHCSGPFSSAVQLKAP